MLFKEIGCRYRPNEARSICPPRQVGAIPPASEGTEPRMSSPYPPDAPRASLRYDHFPATIQPPAVPNLTLNKTRRP